MRAGRVLLIRRQRSHGAGSWSTPGGHLDFGETPAACAMRETEEETGVRVARVEFLAITNDVFLDDDKHYITVWMRGESGDGEARVLDAAEVAEVGWFAPDALPAPLFLSLENLLRGRGLPAMSPRAVFEPLSS
jgi:8-oxo-dGTP diphosphatase